MSARSWKGGAVWPTWREEGYSSPAGKTGWTSAELCLNDKGGRLRAGPTFPRGLVIDIRFGWAEVEKVERIKLLGIPFSGEAARFTLSKTPTRDESRAFLFFTFLKRRTLEILDVAESNGATVARRARIKLTQP